MDFRENGKVIFLFFVGLEYMYCHFRMVMNLFFFSYLTGGGWLIN